MRSPPGPPRSPGAPVGRLLPERSPEVRPRPPASPRRGRSEPDPAEPDAGCPRPDLRPELGLPLRLLRELRSPGPSAGRPADEPRELPAICLSSTIGLAALQRSPPAVIQSFLGQPNVPRAHTNALRATTSTGNGPQREDVRRRPTLPPSPPGSTIGAEGLNFRVRNGAGCFPFAMATETLWRCQEHSAPDYSGASTRPHLGNRTVDAKQNQLGSSRGSPPGPTEYK